MIKFLQLKDKIFTKIKTDLDSVYEDGERSGRPKTATTDEMINYDREIVINDHQLLLLFTKLHFEDIRTIQTVDC